MIKLVKRERGFCMRKFFVSAFLIIGMLVDANAAQAPVARGGARVDTPVVSSTSAARSAVATRGTVGARSAVQPKTVAARSATTPQNQKVAARAATTTQKVINSGTKIASATQNTAVNEECQNKYFGCMDAFCMLDNTSGGRCLCSDRNSELDVVLEEIERLDQQSYEMATLGVEQIEMGENADAAIAKANAVADSTINSGRATKKAREALDLSMWDMSADFDDDDIFSETNTLQMSVDGKTGDALHRAAADLCSAQIPECANDMSMLQLLYGQRIKSDCSAYENSLKQRKSQSQNKLATAQKALREAALEQLQSANKYDLGQCTIQFKKCMQTTGECGDDFSKCASIAALDNTNVNKSTSKKSGNYSIKGDVTTIEISASTYDTLLAKKPLCEGITKSCVAVADKVWETFLRDIAPTIKSAELIAEDNARQSCIGNIAQCFRNACRDTIDPNDPEGSYDMCLTRPETMLSACKIPLNACGIDASSPSKAEKSQIWGFVLARLASMRVDSCTKEVKSCLQSDDRCGSDYTQCIGLDTDTIMRMCPYEKLLGCQQKYGDTDIRGDKVYDEIATMVQGVMLNIDNNMLEKCQQAANAAMIAVCGDTESCNDFAVDNGVGTRSFKYQVCQYDSITGENRINWGGRCVDSLDAISESDLKREEGKGWAGKLSGTMYWGDIEYSCTEDENGASNCGFTTEDEYIRKLQAAGYQLNDEDRQIISERVYGMEMRSLINAVNSAIGAIESDPTVQYCMTGRRVQGMTKSDGTDASFGNRDNARFPNLTSQMRQVIAMGALKNARENYNKKYDSEIARMMQDQVKASQRIDKDQAIQLAQQTCVDWAQSSTLPQSKAPKATNVGKWIAIGLIAAVAVVATVFTFGGGAVMGVSAITALASSSTGVVAAGAGVIATAVGATATAASMAANVEPVGKASVEQWNYKENVTTTFSPATGVCTKVRVYQNCETVKKNYCKYWADPKEERDEVTLL